MDEAKIKKSLKLTVPDEDMTSCFVYMSDIA